MNNLLCSIFITALPTHLRTTKFLQDTWDAIHQSLPPNSVHTVPLNITASGNNSSDSTISVWSSREAMSSVAQGDRDPEEQQDILGLFFKAPFSQESDASAFLEYLGQRLGGNPDSGVSTVDCRVYRRLHGHEPRELLPVHQGIVVVNCMTPSRETEASFNRWYSEEHISMLSAVPGWLSSTRYTLIDSTYVSDETGKKDKSTPRYLALHEWVDDGVFERVEYKSAVDTPWRTEVIGSVQEKQRLVLGYYGKLDYLLRNGSGDQ